MTAYLDFKPAKCKNCYKCLRECPVKAISVWSHQARIVDNRCILCGTCTNVCPQNAKIVHSEIDEVLGFLENGCKVVASVAPSFISSFKLDNFEILSDALKKLGFIYAEETAVGANAVVKEYEKLLLTGKYENFITSSCPAVNRLIQLYYPKALKYLAKVDTPMLVHARQLREKYPDAKIVFIGPCIAKKREGEESQLVDAVLTFEDLNRLLEARQIEFGKAIKSESGSQSVVNKAKYFPISCGIIQSFEGEKPSEYEYVAIDGVKKCMEVLDNIENLSGMFLELNACEYACVNGPCSLSEPNDAIVANAKIRNYVTTDLKNGNGEKLVCKDIEISADYPQIKDSSREVSEREIKEILAKTGKFKKEDELNCGACGYSTCREKAWAVANGYAEVEMCVPYMRERAETMSNEIIENSPNGIIVVDFDLKIIEISKSAKKLLNIVDSDPHGDDLVDYLNPAEFILAMEQNKTLSRSSVFLERQKVYVDITITTLKEHKIIFALLKDVTEEVNYAEKLENVRQNTINIADEVIKKQMRVAQEIASLLGETTAETKVALVNLKKALREDNRLTDDTKK